MLTQHSETTSKTTKIPKLIFYPILGACGLVFAVISITQAFSQPNAITLSLTNDCYRHMSEKIAAHEKTYVSHHVTDRYATELNARCN